MEEGTSLELIKPSGNDNFNIEDFNHNSQQIEKYVNDLKTNKADNLLTCPVSGEKNMPLQDILYNLFSIRAPAPITVGGFDALKITVSAFDYKKISVLDFNMRAKEIFKGGN